MKTNIKKLPKSQLEIEFEILSEEFDKFIDRALLHLQEHIKVDGFRQGQVPRKIIEEKVGEESLLMEAGDLAVKDSYSKFISENNIEPISQPEVQILKVAKNNPFLFKIKITILPEINLPDYKKIASQTKKNKVAVDEKEVEDTLIFIQKSKAKFSVVQRSSQEKDFIEIEYESPQLSPSPLLVANSNDKKRIKDKFILGEGGLVKGFEDNLIGMKSDEEKEFSITFPKDYAKKDLADKEVNFKVKMLSVQKAELPEINDDFARSLGNFANLDLLKQNIKKGLTEEKEIQEKQRQRSEILEKISQKTNLEIPAVLVESEKERLLNDLKEKISKNLKISFADYLASVKKTEEDIKNSFYKEAEKKTRNFLLLREIGKKEEILVEDSEVKQELNKTIKNYPLDVAKKIDIDELKEYIKGVIYNEKVFQKLENYII